MTEQKQLQEAARQKTVQAMRALEASLASSLGRGERLLGAYNLGSDTQRWFGWRVRAQPNAKLRFVAVGARSASVGNVASKPLGALCLSALGQFVIVTALRGNDGALSVRERPAEDEDFVAEDVATASTTVGYALTRHNEVAGKQTRRYAHLAKLAERIKAALEAA